MANVDIIAAITILKIRIIIFHGEFPLTLPINCAKLPVPAKVESSKHTSSMSSTSGSKKVDIFGSYTK